VRSNGDAMNVAEFDYDLPEELIAQRPAERRDESRLMVLDGDATVHRRFRDLPDLLRPDDLLVLNETRVIAARLFGNRAATGGRVELLLLHPARSLQYDPQSLEWIALARPARRLRKGECITFGTHDEATVLRELDDGIREIQFRLTVPFEEFLRLRGRTPLPPYIHTDSDEARDQYQTVFARIPGSVAAPTASLHFTDDVLDEIARRGVEVARISLSVGLGTFRPVTVESVGQHVMHEEAYAIEPEAAAAIEQARSQRRRIVAGGTTVVRALEGSVATHGRVEAGEHATSLFIKPGFRFRAVRAMITNFHLPRSTLLILVCAFAGRERVLRAYRDAIAERYRFYSFGDAMFVSQWHALRHP
jgi:S-adenosylmethionine:tRNA ribosyltransferase-isomerase